MIPRFLDWLATPVCWLYERQWGINLLTFWLHQNICPDTRMYLWGEFRKEVEASPYGDS